MAEETGGVIARDVNGRRRWALQHQIHSGKVPAQLERSRMSTSSAHMMDTTSQIDTTAPELRPLWLRSEHQAPEELAADLKLGGILARVNLGEELDRASLSEALSEACRKAVPGQSGVAANTLEALLCLHLKFSYLATKTPQELQEYILSKDAGRTTRRAEESLLAKMCSKHSFPCRHDSAAVLLLMEEHLGLTLREEDPHTWSVVEAIFKRAHPWAVRTECLLVEGCDDRITVPYSAGKTTNKYYCSPVPTPEVVSRSSCTSSSSNRRTFDSADAARHDMLVNWALKAGVGRDQGGANWREVGNDADDEGGFADRMEDIRRRLLEVFDLDGKTVEAFLTPSGSDAEFLPMALAYVRARRLGHKRNAGPAVTSVVVAAGEVGSGTAKAAEGKHFSKLTPRGVPGRPEHHVKGICDGDISVVQIKPRSKSGAFLPCEDAIGSAVQKATSSSSTSVVVVHLVAGSKTGICSPSVDALLKLRKSFGERLLVVVDACQMRSEAEDIRKYAALGFLTLVTGSKFYCGPPFCGAVLFPTSTLAELEAGRELLPVGFEEYFTRHEVDKRFYSLRSYLAQWENRGLLLRWASALVMMEAYKNIPKESLDIFVGRWLSHVRDTVQEEWPYLSLLPQQRGIQPCKTVGGVNTVVPIVVRVPRRCDGPEGDPEVALGYEDLRLFHRLLSENITRLLPQDLSPGDRASARLRVLFGQPVKLGGASFGAIRIALGADMLITAFSHDDVPLAGRNSRGVTENGIAVDRILAQDRLAVTKCSLMARHWQSLKEAATGTRGAAKASPVETIAAMVKGMGKDDLRVLEALVVARSAELQ